MDLIFPLDNWTLLIRCWQSCFMNVVVLEYNAMLGCARTDAETIFK